MIIQVDKEKLLKEFEEKYVTNRWTGEFDEIIKKYKSDRDSIEEKLISKFDLVCKEAILLQEKQSKGKIKYIYFSLLRASILENKGQWRVDLYDQNWFLDKEECSININLNFIYDSLFNHMEELLEKKNEYGRNITAIDIENIKLKEANRYHILTLQFLKSLIEKFIKISSYEEMKKTKDITILAGEYMDEARIIYSTN
ncbi:hypothetical protein CLPUN_44670 [Clostridium puniceum]|uniref:Uncharacterized protein n=1 Tax=Clostridium puniceum TaxID=29367 RepID=A0A1S8T7K2_9CLOT|nr:hypothetical protein [Clostridium puniceum]OOM73571.1 hypothetical protein CLPUN_44670 [Clostridium puniceum]